MSPVLTESPGSAQVIEWAPFVLAPGTSEEALIEASEHLQSEFLRKQEGFVSRELLRGANGEWADLVVWSSPEAAQRVMERAVESPICHRYFSLMVGADPNDPSGGVKHFRVMKKYL